MKNIINTLLILTCFIPVLFVSGTMYPWNFGKVIFFGIVVFLMLIAFSVNIFYFKKDIKKPTLIECVFIIFILINFISSLLGKDFMMSFFGLASRMDALFFWTYYVLFFLLLMQFRDQIKWGIIFKTISYIGLLSCVLAFFGGSISFLKTAISQFSSSSRTGGIIGNPIFFASYLIVPIFISLYLFLSDIKNTKWVYLGISIICAVTLFFTGTRAVFLAMLVGLVLFLLFLMFNIKNKKLKISLLVGFVLILMVSVFILYNNSLVSKLLSGTGDTRLMSWQIAEKSFIKHPFIGTGYNSFREVFYQNYNPNFLQYSFVETDWDKPHNIFLELAVYGGIMSVLSYILLYVLSILKLSRFIKNSDNLKTKIKYFILIIFFVVYAANLFFSFETINSLVFFMIIIAYLFSASREYGYLKNWFKYIGKAIVVIILLFCIVGINYQIKMVNSSKKLVKESYFASIGSVFQWEKYAIEVLDYKNPFYYESLMNLTQDMLLLDKNEKLEKKHVESIDTRISVGFNDALKKYPNSILYNFWSANVLSTMGEYLDKKYFEESNNKLKHILSINPYNQKFVILLSKNYLFDAKDQDALDLLNKSIEYSKNSDELYWFRGIIYIKKNDIEKGIVDLDKSYQMGYGKEPGNINYLIELYSGLQKFDKLTDIYLYLIEKDNKNATLYANVGVFYCEMNNVDKCLEYFQKASELDNSLSPQISNYLKSKNIKI